MPPRTPPSSRRIPESTTRRLSLYLRALSELEAAGTSTASSGTIAERCQLNPALVRKDLAHFGGFGTRGVGYAVGDLREIIEEILGLHRGARVVIVGAGNLGNALGNYTGFDSGGFDIVALFDVLPEKVGGRTRGGQPIRHIAELEEVIRDESVEIAVLAVPAGSAQAVVDRLAAAGIRAILNFAPTRPEVPEGVTIRHVDLKVELETLSFYLAGQDGGGSRR